LSTKVHAATDALGNPVRFILTGGERNDIIQIEPLLLGLRAGHVLADKGYDGQRAMDAIAASGANRSFHAAQPQPNGAALMQRFTKIAI
jgi:putative transposase